MRKVRSISLKLLGIAAVGTLAAFGYALNSIGGPVRVVEITTGTAGHFAIGESKEALLTRLPNEVYAPRPKPVACPANWIDPKVMTAAQNGCLMAAKEWEVGYGIQSLCPANTDFFATLSFVNDRVAKVSIRCTRPL